MTSIKTKKYIKEILIHPYVGIKIMPFVGDFCGHANNINKSLYGEGGIDKEEFNYLKDLILSIEKNQNEKSLMSLLDSFKEHLR